MALTGAIAALLKIVKLRHILSNPRFLAARRSDAGAGSEFERELLVVSVNWWKSLSASSASI